MIMLIFKAYYTDIAINIQHTDTTSSVLLTYISLSWTLKTPVNRAALPTDV